MPEITQHNGLKKPLASETADISVINDNMDVIDSALGDLSTVPTTAKDAAGAIAELHSEIEAIDVNIPDATLTTKGKVQLSSATSSTAEDRAATPKAVKTAADAAAAAQTTANAAQTKANAALPASSYTAADVLAKIKTVDGVDSGLDADLVRGGRVGAFWQLDNYKLASALPDSYPAEGTTIFFANADHGSHGFPRIYGTVVTHKSYPAAPCTQYFYPYIHNDPIVYRHGLNGNTWSEWRTLWDTSQLRVNSGALEFFDGTTWKGVGGMERYTKTFLVKGGSTSPPGVIVSVSGKAGYLDRAIMVAATDIAATLEIRLDGVTVYKGDSALFTNGKMSTGTLFGLARAGVGGGIRTPGDNRIAYSTQSLITGYPHDGISYLSLPPERLYFKSSMSVELTRNFNLVNWEIAYGTE